MSIVESILEQEVLRRHGFGPLSPAQMRILQLAADGHRRKDIAEQAGLGEETVKEQLRFVYQRLGARNVTNATAIAVRKGII